MVVTKLVTLNFCSETQNCRKWSQSFALILFAKSYEEEIVYLKNKKIFNSVIKHSSKLKMRNRGVNIREKEDKISHINI